MMKAGYRQTIEISILLTVLVGIIAVVNPSGNFPLNDDWSYSRSALIYFQSSRLELTGWCCVPLLPQVFWGALWCNFLGFSFETLRLSTIVLSMIGMVFVYLTALEFSANRTTRILLFFVIALNPIYFLLSNTFMTDVPFFSTAMIAVYFYVRYFHTENSKYIIAAVVFSILSALFRQLGIFFILAFALLTLCKKNNSYLLRLLPLLAFIIATVGLTILQNSIPSQAMSPFTNNIRVERIFESFSPKKGFGLIALTKTTGMILIYLGLFLSPVVIFFSRSIYKSVVRKKQFFIANVSIAILIFFVLAIFHKFLPLRPNVMWSYGLGPATLRDVDALLLPNIPQIPETVWAILTLIGILGGLAIIYFLYYFISRTIRRVRANTELIFSSENFLLLSAILLMLPLCLMEFYDRYLLIFIPLFGFLLIRRFGQSELVPSMYLRTIAVSALALMVLFSITATHDYFAMNRSRWALLNYTMNVLHVKPESIDGGFEFNGWYCYDPLYRKSPDKTWWWVKNDSFVLTFGKMKNYSIIKTEPYYSWLFQKEVTVNLSMKLSSSSLKK